MVSSIFTAQDETKRKRAEAEVIGKNRNHLFLRCWEFHLVIWVQRIIRRKPNHHADHFSHRAQLSRFIDAARSRREFFQLTPIRLAHLQCNDKFRLWPRVEFAKNLLSRSQWSDQRQNFYDCSAIVDDIDINSAWKPDYREQFQRR